jgi:regulator of protease activity HflC (stomatin/prohibitin superfamily)
MYGEKKLAAARNIPVKKIVLSAIFGLVLIFGMFSVNNLVEFLPADEIMVIQFPSGKLAAYTNPGYYAQWFGNPIHFKRRAQFWFSSKSDQGKTGDESIQARFNDGGHGSISGSLSWELPTNETDLLEIVRKYGTMQAVEQQIVRVQTEKAVYMTGSLMSSKESAAEKRPELLYYIEDQLQNGVYHSENKSVTTFDPMTSMSKTVIASTILRDPNGLPLRVEDSLLKQFKIRASSVAINQIKYDDKVEGQIQAQQQAIMDIQTAIAEAKKAEQRKLTVESEGQASAAKQKWDQEAIKAKEVTKAEQEKAVAEKNADRDKKVAETNAERDKQVAEMNANRDLNVAKLNAQAAEQFKTAETLKGEGEAARRKLVMEADGALEKKLEAFVTVNAKYAEALQHCGALVPSIVMGNGNGQTSSATDVMDLIKVNMAKQLSLDLSPSGVTTQARPQAAPAVPLK